MHAAGEVHDTADSAAVGHVRAGTDWGDQLAADAGWTFTSAAVHTRVTTSAHDMVHRRTAPTHSARSMALTPRSIPPSPSARTYHVANATTRSCYPRM